MVEFTMECSFVSSLKVAFFNISERSDYPIIDIVLHQNVNLQDVTVRCAHAV
jgi:hypothetical protein